MIHVQKNIRFVFLLLKSHPELFTSKICMLFEIQICDELRRISFKIRTCNTAPTRSIPICNTNSSYNIYEANNTP